MTFKIRGTAQSYSSLQELEENLNGVIKKKSKHEIIIDWQWKYESGENEKAILESDKMDTSNGKNLESYNFKIVVTGEEVV